MQDIILISFFLIVLTIFTIILIYWFKFRSKPSKSSKEGTKLDYSLEDEETISIKDLSKVKHVAGLNKPIIIYFHSKTCPGCRILSPQLDLLKEEYSDKISYVSYSLDDHFDEMKSIAINYVPTVLILDQDADLLFNLVGVKGGDAKGAASTIKAEINKLLTND